MRGPGRDLANAVHILVAPSSSERVRASAQTSTSSSRSVEEYVATSECRGQFLSREIDSFSGLPCLLGGRLPCDRCAANNFEHEHDDHEEESDTEQGVQEDNDCAGVTETETEVRDGVASSVCEPVRGVGVGVSVGRWLAGLGWVGWVGWGRRLAGLRTGGVGGRARKGSRVWDGRAGVQKNSGGRVRWPASGCIDGGGGGAAGHNPPRY